MPIYIQTGMILRYIHVLLSLYDCITYASNLSLDLDRLDRDRIEMIKERGGGQLGS